MEGLTKPTKKTYCVVSGEKEKEQDFYYLSLWKIKIAVSQLKT